MPQFERHFTLGEAQALLPWVRSIFQKIFLLIQAGTEAPPGLSSASPGHSNGNGHGHGAATPGESVPALIAGIAAKDREKVLQALVQAILDAGIVIQDVRRGLIDFPSWRSDREVFLCYQLADGEAVQFWHELDTGFAGRREIEGDPDFE